MGLSDIYILYIVLLLIELVLSEALKLLIWLKNVEYYEIINIKGNFQAINLLPVVIQMKKNGKLKKLKYIYIYKNVWKYILKYMHISSKNECI